MFFWQTMFLIKFCMDDFVCRTRQPHSCFPWRTHTKITTVIKPQKTVCCRIFFFFSQVTDYKKISTVTYWYSTFILNCIHFCKALEWTIFIVPDFNDNFKNNKNINCTGAECSGYLNLCLKEKKMSRNCDLCTKKKYMSLKRIKGYLEPKLFVLQILL